jgi:hypothetical protein
MHDLKPFLDRRLVLDHHTIPNQAGRHLGLDWIGLDWIGLRKLLALVTRSYL